ncbi:hypothetical protein D1BOALGB6SA_7157 [Olavius sp. associated proteobacterium Delta 1]|nr:hypothetical protein D1BOALGB6SA_7157 [Olavius sp. associated proteobacterium Delta 1]
MFFKQQMSNHKIQTNSNDQNSKIRTQPLNLIDINLEKT